MNNDYREKANAIREKEAWKIFPIEINPEKYAAQASHQWTCCSYINYSYSDPRIEKWMREFEKYLTNRALLNEARQKYLTLDEIREIEEYENDI